MRPSRSKLIRNKTVDMKSTMMFMTSKTMASIIDEDFDDISEMEMEEIMTIMDDKKMIDEDEDMFFDAEELFF